MIGFNFAPRGWAFCDGQILPINQNQSLYSLLGTTYGGDGRTSFALPDLRGRVPIHVGASNGGEHHAVGQKSGEETHTLAINEMPNHIHQVEATGTAAISPAPTDNHVLAATANQPIFGDASNPVPMGAETIGHVGGSQAHDNMMPYIALNFCIALQGLFPSRN